MTTRALRGCRLHSIPYSIQFQVCAPGYSTVVAVPESVGQTMSLTCVEIAIMIHNTVATIGGLFDVAEEEVGQKWYNRRYRRVC